MKSKEIYAKTELESWFIIIRTSCLNCFDKIAQMDPATRARFASHYASAGFKRPSGRPAKRWLRIIKQKSEN